MKQVIALHGGDAFSDYNAYLAFLKDFIIDGIEFFKLHTDWKRSLPAVLGDGYDVLLPQLPNKWNVRYPEWKLWFEKMFPFLADEVILIGHSLGACFLTKYLSENTFPKRITALFLVAGPYDLDYGKPIPGFDFPASLASVAEQVGGVFLYHSKDDPIVPIAELAKYQKAFPNATVRVFEDRGHFNQETFPELVADMQSL